MKVSSIIRMFVGLGCICVACSGGVPIPSSKANPAPAEKPTVDTVAPPTQLRGPYLGQTPPGKNAEIFAPGIVSKQGRYEYALSFAPDGKAILFTVTVPEQKTQLFYSAMTDNGWSELAPIQLTGGQRNEEMEAFFCPDGKTVFFAPYDEGLDVRIWRVTRENSGFGQGEKLDSPVNDVAVFYPTCAADGTLYYSNILEKKIYRSVPEQGTYRQTAQAGIDDAGHCFIAPDQKLVLIDSRRDGGFGDSDIYWVQKEKDDTWGVPQNLGKEVNTPYSETCPSLSPDGKYIFFSRYDEPDNISNIYWVSSEILTSPMAH